MSGNSKLLDFAINSSGGERLVADRKFVDEHFSEFLEVARLGASIRVENCEFLNCKIPNQGMNLNKFVTLEDVLFENIKCGEKITISSAVSAKRVKFSGSSPSSIIIGNTARIPPEQRSCVNDNICYDFSNFTGAITVSGLPEGSVLINPDKHVTIRADILTRVDWNQPEISPRSWWRMVAVSAKNGLGVESHNTLPDPSWMKKSDIALAELDYLREIGAVAPKLVH